MDFGNRLKAIRKEHGYSQETFAQELNRSRQAVSKWESGQGYPETETLIQISHMFGITIDYLLKGEENSTVSSRGYYVNKELLAGFMNYKRHSAKRIAMGVGLLIASSDFFLIPDNLIGMILGWLCVAVSISILIWQKFLPNHYKVLYYKELTFEDSTVKDFMSQYNANRRMYGIVIIVGVMLIVLSSPIEITMLAYGIPISYVDVFQSVVLLVAIVLFILAGIPCHAENYMKRTMEGTLSQKGRGGKWLYSAIPITIICVIAGIVYHPWSPIMPVIVLVCLLLIRIYKCLSARESGGETYER